MVGVIVCVGVSVGVVTRPVDCKTTKINAAPSPRINTIKPMAAGRLTFNSGNLGACTGLASCFFGEVAKVRPQTKQRVAFSLNRVPQVGQVFGVDEVDSGVMVSSFNDLLNADYNICIQPGFLRSWME